MRTDQYAPEDGGEQRPGDAPGDDVTMATVRAGVGVRTVADGTRPVGDLQSSNGVRRRSTSNSSVVGLDGPTAADSAPRDFSR